LLARAIRAVNAGTSAPGQGRTDISTILELWTAYQSTEPRNLPTPRK
jgi:hypothetical protein